MTATTLTRCPRQPTRAAAALAALLACAAPGPASALDVDPGDYAAAPPGTSLALGYALFGWNNSFVTRTGSSINGSHVDSQTGILRLVHYVDIGITADPQIFLPFGFLNDGKLGGESLSSASGFGDIILASTFWFVNQPEKKRWFGITPFMFFPTGSYRNKQVLNIGGNRYKGVLQAGYVEGFGPWTVDAIADTTFYGDNPNGGPDGRSTVQQDNSYQLQAWLRYAFTPEWEVGAGWSGEWGGKVEYNGDNSALATEAQQLRLITKYALTEDWHLQATVRTDVWREGGFKETVGAQFRVMKVF